MFNAIEPIYRTFFDVLQTEFVKTSADKDKLLSTLDMGFSLPLTGKTIVSSILPYVALEWCEIEEIEGYRMPESYKYELRLPLMVITQSEKIDAKGKIETLFPGVGQITKELGGFFWRQHHTGRFSEAVTEEENGWDWSIIDFSMDIRNPLLARSSTDSPLLQRFRELLEKNSLCRGTQMNFYFQIEERGPLTC